MDLKFTPCKKEYFDQAAALMSQTWNFNEGLDQPKDHSLIFKAYFETSLLDAQYTDFIVDEKNRVLDALLTPFVSMY